MKRFRFILTYTVIIIISGCSGSRYLEMTNTGKEDFRQGNYRGALETSEQIIGETEAKGKSAPGEVYTLAGLSSYELGDYKKSLGYLEKALAQQYSDEELYFGLAKNYKRIDNLSKEIGALESYLSVFPNGAEAGAVRERLFQTCVESENFELAGNLWTEMDSLSTTDVENLETWLILNLMQNNESVCDSLAREILQLDPESEPALKWKAESHFWKAENSYQYQMKAYKENRTRKQYAILLKAFKQVNADFRASRDYFLKLYKMNPDPEYAQYLGNIFTRLEDEGKANYYKRLAN
jgi:tetratricopeptide (TPR) repeat protein